MELAANEKEKKDKPNRKW